MNELSTIEGLPGWEALPAEERLKVRKLHAACREIAAAPNKMAAYKLAAQAMKDAGHPMSGSPSNANSWRGKQAAVCWPLPI